MANDLDLYEGSEIQPFNPGMPTLAPLSPPPDTWGNEVDLLREDTRHQSSQSTLFGEILPAGTTPQQVQAVLGEIAGVYLSDFTKLNYPSALIQSSITFFMENATKAPRQVQPHHNFKLPTALAGDWLAVLFANNLQGLSGTQAQKQQFLNASLAWIDKLNKKLGSGTQMPRTATPTSDPTANLTDAQFEALVKHNDLVKIQTETTLRRKWGSAYTLNVRLAQDYLNKLTPREQEHFSQWTGDFPWTLMLNTSTAIEFLFNAAIGSGTLPQNGADIAKEIREIENVIKTHRRQYLADDQLQARYRTLLTLRDGG